ncbi:hypothetical protein BC629DRAFT_1486424 [Irpex lacteus]|nr:hypothetical protein BC629DRAFT_1486424 [Irpex lacteus]
MTPMSPMLASPKSSRFGFLPGALASTLTLSSPSAFSASSSASSPSKSSSSPSKPSPNKPFANSNGNKPFANANGQRREREREKEPSVMRRIFSPKGKDKVALGVVAANPRDSVDWEFIDGREVPSVDEDEDRWTGVHHTSRAERGGSPVETSSSSSTSHHSARTDTSRRNAREQRETHPHSHPPLPLPEPTQPPEHTAATSRDAAAAFINRPVRHSPLASTPSPLVSLPLVASKHERVQGHTVSSLSSGSNNLTNGQLGTGSASSPLARRQTLSTSHASPSVVWLPLITSEDGSMPFPPSSRMPMPPRSPVTVHARNPSAPSIGNSQAGHGHGHGRPPPHVVTSPLAFSITPTYEYEPDEQSPSPSPTFTESPASASASQDLPFSPSFSDTRSIADMRDREVRDTRRAAPPPLRSPASTSTLASTTTTTYDYDSGSGSTSSPTTPTRHYHGRPLPQTPGPAGPFERAGHTPLFRPAFLPAVLGGGGQLAAPQLPADIQHDGYPGPYEYSDLDVYAAQVVDSDDRDGGGRRYEDLLRIAEMAGPAVSPYTPHTPHRPRREGEGKEEGEEEEEEGLKLPPSGRVKLERRRVMKDGRVKLKLTLMEVVVDKCSICLSQFKEAEVACLGTMCPHAFHEYCLKRWIATRRSCPLCRAEI